MQLRYELYAEYMYDNYAHSSFEHIDRNLNIQVVMRSSDLMMTGLCCCWSGKSFWLFSYIHDAFYAHRI